jgi:DNA repair protein RadC
MPAQILMPMLAHREQEYMVVMPLDTRNHMLDVIEIYHGSLNSSMVRVVNYLSRHCSAMQRRS